MTIRPCRSALYVPASRERAMEKARSLPADAIIFDLEDAVLPEEKPAARTLLAQVLAGADFGGRLRIVRINGLDTEWGRADAMALRNAVAAGTAVDAILLPKVSRAADLDLLADMVPGVDLWAMMETAAGMLNAGAIATHPRLRGMVMGTNDLARELGARDRPDRMPLLAGLQMCLLAARAQGLIILDGVFNAFRDAEGLTAECAQGRDMGFDGKTLIHPSRPDRCRQCRLRPVGTRAGSCAPPDQRIRRGRGKGPGSGGCGWKDRRETAYRDRAENLGKRRGDRRAGTGVMRC